MMKIISIMIAEILTAELSSSKSSQAENMPVVRVSIPSIFIAPNSFIVSNNARVRPAMIAGLARGNEILKKVELRLLPRIREHSM